MDVSIDRTWFSYYHGRVMDYSDPPSQAHTVLLTVPGMNSSTTRIEGLDPDTVYTVQVSATTDDALNQCCFCRS